MKSVTKLKDQARKHEQKEEWQKAIDAYLQVLKTGDEGDAEVELPLYNRVGDLYVRMGRPDDAVKYYEQAADQYAEAGLFNNAIALCNKALRYVPDRVDVLRKLGEFSASQGFLTDARRWFLEYAEKMSKAGQVDAAFAALEQFAETSEDPAVRELLADRLEAHDRIAEAVTELQRAYGMRAAAGEAEAAETLKARILELDPNAVVSSEGAAAGMSHAGPASHALPGLADLPEKPTAPPPEQPAAAQEAPRADAQAESEEEAAPEDGVEAIDIEPTSLDTAAYGDVELGNLGLEGFESTQIGGGTPDEVGTIDLEGLEGTDLSGTVELEADADEPAGELPGLDEDQDPGFELPSLDDEEEAAPLPGFDDDDEEAAAALPALDEDEAAEAAPLPGLDDEEDTAPLPDLEDEEGAAPLPGFDDEENEADTASLPGLDDEELDQLEVEPLPADAAELQEPAGARAEEGFPELAGMESGLDAGAGAGSALAADGEPLDVEAERTRVAELKAGGRIEEAADLLRRLHTGLAARERHADALTVAEELIDLEPDALTHHQRAVEYAVALGDTAAQVRTHLGLAQALERAGSPTKARAMYQRVLELDPDNATAGEALREERGQVQEGFVDLFALVSDERQDPDTRFVVAENAPSGDEDRDFAELLSQFKQKVSENVAPEDAGSHYDLGLAFKEMGLVDEAIAEFQVALRGGDERLKIYEELGQCFILKEQYNIALKVLQRALQVPFDDELELIGVYYHLGRVQEALGARSEAREAYERVLGLDISFADVNERMARL
ncbi:MAG: tetratricopeptide repeat protein [Gemmatimonadota bacterium]